MLRFFAVGSLLILVGAAGADQPQKQEPMRLTLTPAKPLRPVLRFALLPELRDKVPGDAGPIYLKAAKLRDKMPPSQEERNELYFRRQKWEKMPLEELPLDEVHKMLAIYKEPLALLDKASHYENCNWSLSQQQREKGMNAPVLSEILNLAMFDEILCLKARLELAEGHPDRALRTLQTAYQLGQRLGEVPMLITALAGTIVTHRINKVLEEILAHPKSPNLYWSLTNLPRPFANTRKPLEGERLMVYGTFPGALALGNDPEQVRPMTEEQGQNLIKLFLEIQNKPAQGAERVQLTALMRDKHDTAKRALLAKGWPRDMVEAWPPAQVALMHALIEYDQLSDELLKWQTFPYFQAQAALEQLERKLKAARERDPDSPAWPLAPVMLSVTPSLLLAQARLDRSFAALRCIEAVRLYAADKGELPSSLNDVTEVPIPVCPITGKPFEYRLQGDKALLSAPEVPARVGNVQPLAYELILRR